MEYDMISKLLKVNVVNDYSRHCEKNLDFVIFKINTEYSDFKRVGNQTQKMASSKEGSVTQIITNFIVQGEDIQKTKSFMTLPKETCTK